MASFASVPEFVETELAESLIARSDSLASFRELGPPDLAHVIKTVGRAGTKDIGSYHYVSGVDASSSASLAAYLNVRRHCIAELTAQSLQYEFESQATWLGGKAKSDWRIRAAVFCSFNAFSRVDVRVEVKIYAIDLRGERHELTPRLWTEVYLSALLRAILYADDPAYRLAGYRRLDPIRSLEDEMRFLAAAEQCFAQGWQLGSDPEVQVATAISNHLTAGIMRYFGDAYRYGPAVNLFEKLLVRDPEVAALLAKAYIGMNEEVKAVQVLHAAIKQSPQSYALLHVQADFVRSKGRPEWALELARTAVNCAPSEFQTWAKLTEIHMELEQWTDALLTLNSCPMFTYNERDLHRMPAPARTHLPIKPFIAESDILDDDRDEHEADVALLRLPAPSLRGTFAKAYALLAKLVSVIGWDELLKCRSQVFVMEEEYRAQKSQVDVVVANGHASSPPVSPPHEGRDDDAASTRAVVSPPELTVESAGSASVADQLADSLERSHMSPPQSPIPTIRISSESDDRPSPSGAGVADAGEAAPVSDLQADAPGIEKPRHTRAPEEKPPPTTTKLPFSNKRLCERWLDNLFLVLYEDLRVYTIWRAEVAHFKAQHMPYRKTGTEWEILGDLAARLGKKEEAKDAMRRCLDLKFSAGAWLKLLETYADEGDVQRALGAATRLATYNARWYQESSYPSAVAHQLFKLIRREGLSKVSYSLVALNLPQPILKLMQPMVSYAQMFSVEGSAQ